MQTPDHNTVEYNGVQIDYGVDEYGNTYVRVKGLGVADVLVANNPVCNEDTDLDVFIESENQQFTFAVIASEDGATLQHGWKTFLQALDSVTEFFGIWSTDPIRNLQEAIQIEVNES